MDIHNNAKINDCSSSLTVYGILSVVSGTKPEITRRLHRPTRSFGGDSSGTVVKVLCYK